MGNECCKSCYVSCFFIAQGVSISSSIVRIIGGISVGFISVGGHVLYIVIFGVGGDFGIAVAIALAQGKVNRFRISSIIVNIIGGISFEGISVGCHVFWRWGKFSICGSIIFGRNIGGISVGALGAGRV